MQHPIYSSTGTSASDLHYHAYLLDGVFRWNQDRGLAAVKKVEFLRVGTLVDH